MLDPFLTGLVAGAAVGAAGLGDRVLKLAVLAALGLIAWGLVQYGTDGLEEAVHEVVTAAVLPHGRLLAGAAAGALLGSVLFHGRSNA